MRFRSPGPVRRPAMARPPTVRCARPHRGRCALRRGADLQRRRFQPRPPAAELRDHPSTRPRACARARAPRRSSARSHRRRAGSRCGPALAHRRAPRLRPEGGRSGGSGPSHLFARRPPGRPARRPSQTHASRLPKAAPLGDHRARRRRGRRPPNRGRRRWRCARGSAPRCASEHRVSLRWRARPRERSPSPRVPPPGGGT
jgi:hypothetical protein